MKITVDNLNTLAWDKMSNLLPCVVQDVHSGEVLMLGYMNQDALLTTLNKGLVTFYSRSKSRLWTKGESSQNTLELKDISADCDLDSILVLAKANGPTCHKGSVSCWAQADKSSIGFLSQLEKVIASRKNAPADSSYTASLYASGIKRIAQKVGEEGVETALAATVQDLEELKNESADLLYHLIVLLQASDLSLNDALEVLKKRHKSK